ncbi:MAG: type IV pilus biogenesis/stability protein PilW [Gammaproteobacteria bacterium]|nr:type IV pilus biogenesis/stability protein PilW [Gammaproteobacteria bacterium]
MKRPGWLLCGALVLTLAACAPSPARKAAEQAESPAQAYTNLGLAYLQQGNRKLAVEKLQRALEADPDFPAAHHYIAEAYQQSGQMDKAEQHYQRAVKLDPSDPMLQNNFGAFLCGRGNYEGAEKQFLSAAKNPRYETPELAYENAGMCSQRVPDAQKAEQYFRAALEINAKLPGSLYQMAALNYDKKNYLPARAYLQRYLAVAPHTPQSLWLGVRIERELGDNATVAEYAKQLKNNFPAAEETRLLLETERK